MKIDFLVAKNHYQTTTHFSRKCAEALQRLGVDVRLLFLKEGSFSEMFDAVRRSPPDLTCSFSDITAGDKRPIGDLWKIPHLSLLIDPAVYFLHQLQSPYSILSCVDQEDAAFLKALGCTRSFFLPHAVEKERIELRDNQRLYERVFFGTCIDYLALEETWKLKYDDQTGALLHDGAERVLTTKHLSCLRVLLEAGVKEELPLLHQELDLYIRGKERIALLRSVSGKSCHIWGRGNWRKYLGDRTEISLHPAVSFQKTLGIIKNAKVLLNSSPRFKYGSHERVFYALASGCAVVTGENAYLEETLSSLLTYPYGQYEYLQEKIETTLASESKRQEIVLSGQDALLRYHTWDIRMKELLSELGCSF